MKKHLTSIQNYELKHEKIFRFFFKYLFLLWSRKNMKNIMIEEHNVTLLERNLALCFRSFINTITLTEMYLKKIVRNAIKYQYITTLTAKT